jgi:hypothetical protein
MARDRIAKAPVVNPANSGTLVGYKLFRQRRDGSLGPLFINPRQRLEPGPTYVAECHPTPGFSVRPGWHICSVQYAPHLSQKGRVWCRVRFSGYKEHRRPDHQGGLWYTANFITILEILP